MSKKQCTLIIIMFVTWVNTFAQFSKGNNPSGIKWKYYDTKAARVIFPAGIEQDAARVANIINYINDSVTSTVGTRRKKIDLLIQTHQVVSNGYVGLAPFRSEFYATGLQDFNVTGSMRFLDMLSIHEFRHAQQISNTRNGLTKFASILAGQQGWSFLLSIAVPNWYFEGDAVQTETVLTEAGRGRTASFLKEQKALMYNNRHYGYMKARNGSFKEIVPDHYRLGYAMLQHVRNEHGPETWAKILNEGSSYRGIIYPFSRAMKRNTGLGSRGTYYQAYKALDDKWQKELTNTELIETKPVIEHDNHRVTNYNWPVIANDGSVICVKDAYNRISRIVRIKDGKEETLHTIGVTVDSYISLNNNKIAWVEYSVDIRRANRNYAEIHMYDIEKGESKKVTTNTKYFAPHFSSKGDKIVAAKADEHLKRNIVVVDASTGEELNLVNNPDNDVISYPHWTENDEAIVFIAQSPDALAIKKYVFATGETTQLTPWTKHTIGAIAVGKKYVYYDADYTGVANVFAVSLNGDMKIRQLSSVKINGTMPAVSDDETKLYLSSFDYTGDELVMQPINADNAKIINVVEPAQMSLYGVKTTKEESKIFSKIYDKTYSVKDYKGRVRNWKLHSWRPDSDSKTYLALMLRADNILNDKSIEVTAGYNFNENAMYFSGYADYSRFFLIFRAEAELNERNILTPTNLSDTGATYTNTLTFHENVFKGSLVLPLTKIHGAYTSQLELKTGLGHISTNSYNLNNTDILTSMNDVTFGEVEINLSNSRKRAYQHINTRFGQVLNAHISSGISGASAARVSVQGKFYFPGMIRNHSLYFNGGWKQEKISNQYLFKNEFEYARGYSNPLLGDESYVYGVNYQFPLFYPDLGFAGLVYVKRVRLNLFADFSQIHNYSLSKTFDQNSYGLELLFDFISLNLMPLSGGIRGSVLSDRDYFDKDKTGNIELFFNGTF